MPGPEKFLAWQKLTQQKPVFDGQPYQCEGAGWTLDLSTSGIDSEILENLLVLAQEAGLEQARDAQLNGDIVNASEHRAALHTALRAPADEIPAAVKAEIIACRAQMAALTARIAALPITDIIHVGMGGSGLAPALLHKHFSAKYEARYNLNFIMNIDTVTLDRVMKNCNPASTLVIIASKNFNTEETIICMQALRAWLGDYAKAHMIAITAKSDMAQAAGFSSENILPMWDWVGGRFSLWSAVSFPIILAYGVLFDECLAGAYTMDQHYKSAPPARNLPFLLALAHIWQGNFMNCRSHAILPYADALAVVPPYLQQLEMESNGKPAAVLTAPTIFGGVGASYQHSFSQWMHEGTDMVSADLIIPLHANCANDMQARLVANALAQSEALARGRPPQFLGGRPTNLLMIDYVTPAALGSLLALYEHKVFLQSRVWGINCYDQPAVELGKVLARGILPHLLAQKPGNPTTLSSTDVRIARYTAAQSNPS